MTTIWEPQPSADEIMRSTAQWVARLYGVKITFTIDDGRGSVGTTVIDRLPARRTPAAQKETPELLG